MKNYKELEKEVRESFKKEYPEDFKSEIEIDFSYGEDGDLPGMVNNICGDILDIIYDCLGTNDGSYNQVSYFSKKLNKLIILDSSVEETYDNAEELIISMMEYQKQADKLEDSITIYEDTIDCDNVDCEGNCENIEPVLMNAEFQGGVVNWCQGCRERDEHFIDELPEKLASLTLEHLSEEYGSDYEPLDGDNTEDIAKAYLCELNKLMGNK